MRLSFTTITQEKNNRIRLIVSPKRVHYTPNKLEMTTGREMRWKLGWLIISSSYSGKSMEFLVIRNISTDDLAPSSKQRSKMTAEFRTLKCLLPMFSPHFYLMLRILEPSRAWMPLHVEIYQLESQGLHHADWKWERKILVGSEISMVADNNSSDDSKFWRYFM